MDVVWTPQNIDPNHINPELATSEPYADGAGHRVVENTMTRSSVLCA
jgi:hypothetical protein